MSKKRNFYDANFIHPVNLPDRFISISLGAVHNLAVQAFEAERFNFEVAVTYFGQVLTNDAAEDFFWSMCDKYHDGALYNPQFYDALFFGAQDEPQNKSENTARWAGC